MTAATVRVADGEPGSEVQVDFDYLGLLADPVFGQRRKVHALIFTACYSRHLFVWLSFSQTLTAVTAGCQAAWEIFGGAFKVVVCDSAAAMVASADPVNPRPSFLAMARWIASSDLKSSAAARQHRRGQRC